MVDSGSKTMASDQRTTRLSPRYSPSLLLSCYALEPIKTCRHQLLPRRVIALLERVLDLNDVSIRWALYLQELLKR